MHPSPLLGFTIDSTGPQIAADLLLLVLVGVNALLGWQTGLVRRVLAFGGAYAGVLAASYTANPVGSLISAHSLYANALTFIVVFAALAILVEVLTALYSERLKKLIVVTFDRSVGLIVGIFVGLCQTAVIMAVALAVLQTSAGTDSHTTLRSMQNATLTEYVVKPEPFFNAVFTPTFSGLQNTLSQGTTGD